MSAAPPPRPIAEWQAVDRQLFEQQIVPRGEPVVLRGLVAHWPVVHEARRSDAALCQYLTALDSGADVDALMLPPREHGRIFYGAGFAAGERGFNYLFNRLPISRVIEQLQRYALFAEAPAVVVQSALASVCAPTFTASHGMPLLDASVGPRLWLGGAVITPAHFDESSNIACVAAGERCFTLFPPEQVDNLYVGPFGHAPTGTPISLVDLAAPDFERFPRLRTALEHARSALLAPGDAIYIPPLWWHHVVSRKTLNLLVNYWWGMAGVPSGLKALQAAQAAFGAFPPAQRRAWAALLAHWVFEADDETFAHIPAALRDKPQA